MRILLHICCSNCAIYPVKTLRGKGYNLTGFWFNPNIQPYQEYKLRLDSLKDLTNRWRFDMIYMDEYAEGHALFKMDEITTELHEIPKYPERCKSCYRLRLEKTAEQAQKQGFDAFSTTLLISPYQDFEQIVTIGRELADKYNVLFYLRDYRQYFREAMAYAKEFGLYRQKYCGCIYSREERKRELNSKSKIRNSK